MPVPVPYKREELPMWREGDPLLDPERLLMTAHALTREVDELREQVALLRTLETAVPKCQDALDADHDCPNLATRHKPQLKLDTIRVCDQHGQGVDKYGRRWEDLPHANAVRLLAALARGKGEKWAVMMAKMANSEDPMTSILAWSGPIDPPVPSPAVARWVGFVLDAFAAQLGLSPERKKFHPNLAKLRTVLLWAPGPVAEALRALRLGVMDLLGTLPRCGMRNELSCGVLASHATDAGPRCPGHVDAGGDHAVVPPAYPWYSAAVAVERLLVDEGAVPPST